MAYPPSASPAGLFPLQMLVPSLRTHTASSRTCQPLLPLSPGHTTFCFRLLQLVPDLHAACLPVYSSHGLLSHLCFLIHGLFSCRHQLYSAWPLTCCQPAPPSCHGSARPTPTPSCGPMSMRVFPIQAGACKQQLVFSLGTCK